MLFFSSLFYAGQHTEYEDGWTASYNTTHTEATKSTDVRKGNYWVSAVTKCVVCCSEQKGGEGEDSLFFCSLCVLFLLLFCHCLPFFCVWFLFFLFEPFTKMKRCYIHVLSHWSCFIYHLACFCQKTARITSLSQQEPFYRCRTLNNYML